MTRARRPPMIRRSTSSAVSPGRCSWSGSRARRRCIWDSGAISPPTSRTPGPATPETPPSKPYTGTLTNGTPGILDNQDAFTVTVALSGYFFEKTVADLTSGANPATTAAPGDKLRYTLRFRTTTQALSNFRIFDELDALNSPPDFAPGTLTLVTPPAGADISATSSTGRSQRTGVIDLRNLSLPGNSEVLTEF